MISLLLKGMIIDDLLPMINYSLWDLTGIFFLLFIFIFLLFSLIVVRQVQLLNNILGTTLSPVLKLISYIHVFFALSVFILALLRL